MFSSAIKTACERAGLVNTCVGADSCPYSGSGCTITSLTGCGNPLFDFAKIFDCSSASGCSQLFGVFAYMDNYNDQSCGVTTTGDWNCNGKSYSDQSAICAKRKGK